MDKLKVTYLGSKYYRDGWLAGVVKIKEVLEDNDENFSPGQQFNVRGDAGFEPLRDTEYTLTGELINDKTWGKQIEIYGLTEEVELETEDDKRYFLSQILTENQVNELYKTYDDPFLLLQNEDIPSLIKVNGIQETMARKLISRFQSTIDNAPAYVYFKKFDVTNNLVNKLVRTYKTPTALISAFEENPYILMEDVDGIGFIKADEIALKSGVQKTSPLRIKNGILHILRSEAENNGSTWVSPSYFRVNIVKLLGISFDDIKATFKDMVDNELLYITEDKTKIALKVNYELEKNVANKILQFCKYSPEGYNREEIDTKISKQEEFQGFVFTEEQREGIHKTVQNNFIVITGNAGCVDGETEFFNGYEWKKIKEYQDGELVLQSDIDGNSYLDKPISYIKEVCNEMYYIKNTSGLDQMLSDDHNVLYITSRGNYGIKSMAQVYNMNEKTKYGFQGQFPATFNYNGEGISLTDNEIKLMCAVICDGSFLKSVNTNRCVINIKKQRKKIELENILKSGEFNYLRTDRKDGYSQFRFDAPIREKVFSNNWYKCNNHQLKIISENILKWDGSTLNHKMRFATNNKETADFVQFVFCSQGYKTSIKKQDRVGEKQPNSKYFYKSVEYTLNISKIKVHSFAKTKKSSMDIVKTIDGFKYCFETNPGYLILRRNNNIFRTCNCGKTTVVKGFLAALGDNQSIALTSLSGQASKRMSEATGYPASTIHRLLGYVPDMGFTYNANNTLPYDVVILDECSMVSVDLFWNLIRAMRVESKLIILGDDKQLPPIGIGNLFTDLLASDVPKQKLTQIHRQAAKSAIISTSAKIREKKQIVEPNYDNEETLGELQDLTMCVYQDKSMLFDTIIEKYKEEYLANPSVRDIQVVVPMKERGTLSQLELNNKIQELINPGKHKYVQMGKKYIIKVGDKVINRKNHYKIFDRDYKPAQVFNGSMGIVKEIYDDYMIIDFFDIGELRITSDLYKGIQLAYAITCHSAQGSQWRTTIVGLDYGAYILLSSEWIYTAITRASTMCYLIAETKALRYGTITTKIKGRDTFLQELLKEGK